MTLIEAVEAASDRGGRLGFIEEDGRRHSQSWAEVADDGRRAARALSRHGVAPGDRVATLGPTSPELVTATFGIWYSGAVAVPLPLPMRLASIEAFIDQTRRRVEAAECTFVLVDALFAGQVPEIPGVTILSLDGLQSDEPLDRASRVESELALIQYTSGSTTEPRGVMLTHTNLVSSCEAMANGCAFVPEDDVVLSWLPLYHDMGLIGTLLTPAINGADLWLMAPQSFLARPRLWLEAMEATRATITCAPNFAYALVNRMLRQGGLDLSSVRLALNGAEPIDCTAMREFVAAGAACGLRPSAPFPVYGLAEATLAVAFPALDDTFIVDEISRDQAEAVQLAEPCLGGKEVVSEGFPIDGMEIRIAGATGDRQIGEIQLRGAPVTAGYYGRPDLDRELFTDDRWLRTGDLGYFVEGRLHVTGRLKDLIIVGGRNIYPQDIEASVQEVDGIRKGNVVAFSMAGRSGREAIAVVAEARTDEPSDLARAVARRVSDDHGVAPQRIVLIAPGALPKTSSGKVQRRLTRQMLDSGELISLEQLAAV